MSTDKVQTQVEIQYTHRYIDRDKVQIQVHRYTQRTNADTKVQTKYRHRYTGRNKVQTHVHKYR